MIKTFRLATRFRRIPRLLPAFLIFSFVATKVAVQAEEILVKANFSEGDGGSAVDGYPGGAGEGWLEPWRITQPKGGEELFTIKVLQEDPLPEQTHYLHVETKEPQPSITLTRTVNPSALDLSKAHTVSFILRLDALSPPDGEFRFKVSAQQEEGMGLAKTFWYVLSQNGFWYAVGKSESGETKWWKSSVPLRLGTAYSFLVTVDPEAKTFQVKIHDGASEVDSPVILSHAENAQDGASEYSFGGAPHAKLGAVPFAWSLGGVEIRGAK